MSAKFNFTEDWGHINEEGEKMLIKKEMPTEDVNIKRGKKARARGRRFESKVREYLEKEGWICARWTNNVEFQKGTIIKISGEQEVIKGADIITKSDYKIGKLIPAKPKFIYNPVIHRRIPIGMSSGFPDFIAFKIINSISPLHPYKIYEIIGVEAKYGAGLDKEEKEKCKWLIDNHIFSKILIASPGKKRGEIKMEEFKKDENRKANQGKA